MAQQNGSSAELGAMTARPQLEDRRIVLVMDLGSPWSIDIAESLAELGCRVFVLGYSPRSRATDKAAIAREQEGTRRMECSGVSVDRVVCADGRLAAVTTLASRLRQFAQMHQLDLVLCLYGGTFALAACLSGLRPYAIYWVGSDVPSSRSWRQVLLSAVARRAVVNVANGYHLAARAARWFAPTVVQPLYLGIDTRRFRPRVARPESDGVTIICTRWFEPLYDNLTIVRAYPNVRAACPRSRLVFTSSGSQLAEARLLTGAMEGDGSASVGLLGGLSTKELVEQLERADVFVSMSLTDGTSTALLEALAIGLFPVLSDIPANREWLVDHGCDGILVPTRDTGALERAMIEACRDHSRRRAAAVRNSQIVRQLADSRANRQRLLTSLVRGNT